MSTYIGSGHRATGAGPNYVYTAHTGPYHGIAASPGASPAAGHGPIDAGACSGPSYVPVPQVSEFVGTVPSVSPSRYAIAPTAVHAIAPTAVYAIAPTAISPVRVAIPSPPVVRQSAVFSPILAAQSQHLAIPSSNLQQQQQHQQHFEVTESYASRSGRTTRGVTLDPNHPLFSGTRSHVQSRRPSERRQKHKTHWWGMCCSVCYSMFCLAILIITVISYFFGPLFLPPRDSAKSLFVRSAEGNYDYIVVGAGAAGVILADRLASADRSKRVLLMEGGPVPDKQSASASWSAAAAAVSQSAPSVYEVPGQSETAAWARQRSWESTFAFQAKMVGGSTSVNRMIYIRPSDEEVVELGLSSEHLEPLKDSFDEIEKLMPATCTPSKDGLPYFTSSADILNHALRTDNFAKASDLNDLSRTSGGRNKKFGLPPQIVANGSRANPYTVLKDSLAMKGVEVLANAEALRVGFKPYSGHASHVEYSLGGHSLLASLTPTGKVVLAAGALNTPRLLLLSGVGPSADLAKYSSWELFDTPRSSWIENEHVGSGLQDHVQAMMGFSKDGVELFNPDDAGSAANTQAMRDWLLERKGPYTQYGPINMAYFQSDVDRSSGSSSPDLQIETLSHAVSSAKSVDYLLNEQSPGGGLANDMGTWPSNSWASFITLLKPVSRCKITLDKSKKVMYNSSDLYLKEDSDRQRLKEGMTKIVQLAIAAGLSLHVPVSADPAEIDHAVDNWQTSHLIASHFTGSCKLGTCLSANDFRVNGTKNVFVGDASALPVHPPVQPLGIVMAMAHMAGGVISKTANS
eukprot:TRINITY_DN40783_c0_g1_i1.p1 TRINITY_DN40783_c0_g1~~TRINITY_DN40783_c0_g1_i1.p1  ORF type:complete len:802 (+),score=92.80 TRINITY_DN40783_c0_g1_i1:113-2518(+)